MINIKGGHEITLMKQSAALLKDVFKLVEDTVTEGISTKHLDNTVCKFIKNHGAIPSFLGYNGFPASICASIDDVVVHGIPKDNEILQNGQIIGIDIGLILHGYHSDCARTYCVGSVSEEKALLVERTRESFFEGMKEIKSGSRLGDLGANIQDYAESFGYGVVTALTGHGIGRRMHEEPSVPNVGAHGKGIRLLSGMTIAVEPMINMGTAEVDFMPDGWTVRTRDRKPSSHYENTILITDDGVEILTL